MISHCSGFAPRRHRRRPRVMHGLVAYYIIIFAFFFPISEGLGVVGVMNILYSDAGRDYSTARRVLITLLITRSSLKRKKKNNSLKTDSRRMRDNEFHNSRTPPPLLNAPLGTGARACVQRPGDRGGSSSPRKPCLHTTLIMI